MCFEYQKITETTIGITKFRGNTPHLVIPETIDGYTVTRICNYAIDGWWTCDGPDDSDGADDSVDPDNSNGADVSGGTDDFDSTDDFDGFDDFDEPYYVEIREIRIPATVTEIEPQAFVACGDLWRIIVDENNPVYASVDGILYDKALKTLLQCPKGKSGSCSIPDTVTSIEEGAFCFCSLERVVLNGQITKIKKATFYECENLREIVIPDTVKHIDDEAFADCAALAEVALPAQLTDIGERAFFFCTALKQMIIPEGVVRLGKEAFAGCRGLEIISVPESLAQIGEKWLEGCPNLKKIEFAPGNSLFTSEYNAVYNKDKTVLYQCFCKAAQEQFRVPETVTVIEEKAFLNNRYLKEIMLPKALTQIGEKAFCGCENLAEIKIPENVREIGKYAFLDCKNLGNIIVDEKNIHFACEEGVLYTRDKSEVVAVRYGKLFYREDMLIEELGLRIRSCNCLRRAGFRTVGELLLVSREEVMRVRNFGKPCLKDLEDHLEALGVALRAEGSSGETTDGTAQPSSGFYHFPRQ